jgi:hypothetical protein
MLITVRRGNKFTSNFHITSLATILVLSINPLLDFTDGSSVFLKKNLVAFLISPVNQHSDRLWSGRPTFHFQHGRNILPSFSSMCAGRLWGTLSSLCPGIQETVWIWPFISIYCHGQECILSFPHACSWGGFYLITLSLLHLNFGTLFRLFKWAYSRYKKIQYSHTQAKSGVASYRDILTMGEICTICVTNKGVTAVWWYHEPTHFI